jgi:pimeloyl-ACP methyl ester carboxylesterase
MESSPVGEVDVHYVEHGSGRPVIVLHGAGVDHREPEACFEPILGRYGGLRRIYPDLPGMGQTSAPETVGSADDVLGVLLGFVDAVAGDGQVLMVGHSAGAYYARAIGARRPQQVAGLALICPLLPETRDVPPHRVVARDGDLGDEEFRAYFVVQTQEMLDRYQRYVVPGAELADQEAMGRIGERWELTQPEDVSAYRGPTLLVAGRLDSTVGYAATTDLLADHPAASLAVLDGAGHALPHEQPGPLGALVVEWLDRCHRSAATALCAVGDGVTLE